MNETTLPDRFPGLRTFVDWVPFTRDQLVLLLVATNELFLGLDTYLSHRISGTIITREWIPIYFGPIAGVLLLLAGLLARHRWHFAASVASLVLLSSAAVGVLGSWYHFQYVYHPGAPEGAKFSLTSLIWAPPVLGPLSFVLVGWLGISAVWREAPVGSGRLNFLDRWTVQLPYSKSRAYYYIVSLGALIATVSSVIDHARHDFSDPWMWLALAVGLFATFCAFALALFDRPSSADYVTYAGSMCGLLLIGVLGVWFHGMANLTARGGVVLERFIRGAPMMAPLLFTNIGMMGLIVLFPSRVDS